MDIDFESYCLCCFGKHGSNIASSPISLFVQCQLCEARYLITLSAISQINSNCKPSEIFKLSSFIAQKYWREKQTIHLCENRSELDSKIQNGFEVDEIIQLFPESIADIFDNIMLNLFAMNARPSAPIDIPFQTEGQPIPLLFAQDFEVASFYLNALKKDGLISSNSTSGNIWKIQIQPEGFNKIYHLQRMDPALSKNVFVALDFEHKDAYHNAIFPILKDLGFEPICLLDPDHHDHIDYAINAGIRKSRFIVADLTFNNRGAYWEAGLAYGQQKVVILCCQQLEGEKPAELVHFDLNHFKILFYKDWDDLKRQLRDRIEGDGRIAI